MAVLLRQREVEEQRAQMLLAQQRKRVVRFATAAAQQQEAHTHTHTHTQTPRAGSSSRNHSGAGGRRRPSLLRRS